MSSLDNFIYIEGGCHLPSGKFLRNRMMTVDMITDFKQEFNNKGIYLTAYWYDNIDVTEANLYGNFYMDFDKEDDFEQARADAINAVHYLSKHPAGPLIPSGFIRAFFSGKKGIHIVIPAIVFNIEPDKHLNEYYKFMAEKVKAWTHNDTLDFKVYDRRRLFRVPNSIHQATNLYKIPLTMDELKTCTYEEILDKAQAPASPTWDKAHEIPRAHSMLYLPSIESWKQRFEKKFNRDRTNQCTLDYEPPCIKELLDVGPIRGQRNNTAAVLVSYFKKRGYSEQEVWDKITEWNQDSLKASELKVIMDSVYQGEYEYGCSTLEKLATCQSTCKLHPSNRGSRKNEY